jgi:F-type H+/Na+-transporting ATPase subunit alpha
MKIPILEVSEVGTIREIKNGIVRADGLPSCVSGQLVEFRNGTKGIVVGFDPTGVVITVLGDDRQISVSDTLLSCGELLTIPVGEGFMGRAVNCLGQPIDGKGPIPSTENSLAFQVAAGVMEREPISDPLFTGIKTLDLLIPIGKGQRELIIGDRQTGKTSLAIDVIRNQKESGVIPIYCWIGGSYTAFQKIARLLSDKDVPESLICVCAFADSSPAEQYLCPYTAATIGQYLMAQGRDVVVVFDDLTRHAWMYRQMALLMERAPGREAYPGDIFYIHSQLMERAGRMKSDLGGGTMTFLPIAETLHGDITGYIQSNLVSMTDGQIYLDSGLFREGFKPAVDLRLSVSRIGGKVQSPTTRELSSGLRLDYTRYREILRMTQLRTRLSQEASGQLKRGEALRELLIQDRAVLVSLAEMLVLFYAFNKKILEVLPKEDLKQFKENFFPLFRQHHPELVKRMNSEENLASDIKETLNTEFMTYFRGLYDKREKDKE